MERKSFKKIAIIARRGVNLSTLLGVTKFLATRGLQLGVETTTADFYPELELPKVDLATLKKEFDLLLVIGGDGSILHAARILDGHQIPVLGMNLGHLGFLSDIPPHAFVAPLSAVLDGQYSLYELFMLKTEVKSGGKIIHSSSALNEVVLNSGTVTNMIEFAVYINQQFVYQQRSDGLILATPTGSTAYALSGGGPILHPSLNAITLVPMFAHNLTSRPIVINADSLVELKLLLGENQKPGLSCDGQALFELNAECEIAIHKAANKLLLIHPANYNYFETLRVKLHWGIKPGYAK